MFVICTKTLQKHRLQKTDQFLKRVDKSVCIFDDRFSLYDAPESDEHVRDTSGA